MSSHTCEMTRIYNYRSNCVRNFVHHTKCKICMTMCFKCDVCGDIVNSSGHYSEIRCHINHLLTHYGIVLPSTRSHNLLGGSYEDNRWHVSYTNVVRRFPQIRLLQPIMCTKTLNEFLYRQIDRNDWDPIHSGQISVDNIDYMYDPFLLYMRSCSFECSLCENVYEIFPTLDIVISHCVSKHDVRLNVDGLPPLKEFIVMS